MSKEETAKSNNVDLKNLYNTLGEITYQIEAYTHTLESLKQEKANLLTGINNVLAQNSK